MLTYYINAYQSNWTNIYQCANFNTTPQCASTLVVEVVPPALLDFSADILRERFSVVIRKPVFTFVFDRYSKVTPQLLAKLKPARILRAVHPHLSNLSY